MSWFGDGTFKQRILEEIEWTGKDKGLSKPEIVAQVLEVVSHLASTAFCRDEEMQRVREEAKVEAKKEIIKSLGAMTCP